MDRYSAAIERLGARFEDRRMALEAMRQLRERFGLDLSDVEVQALGSTRYEEPPSGTLLAGRFRPEVADQAIDLIRGAGGVIVERRLEPDPLDRRPPPSPRERGRRSRGGRAALWRLDRRGSRDAPEGRRVG
jgi:hypothetical protein